MGVVGHSLFFRKFLTKYLANPREASGDDEGPYVQVALSLATHVLPFCGVLGCLLDWDEEGRASIVEAVPFLNTSLRSADLPTLDLTDIKAWPPQPQGKIAGCMCSRKDGCAV